MSEPSATAQKLPEEIYATLSGVVDTAMVQRVLANGGQAVTGGVKRLHLLLHSTGGSITDGILLYNYLRRLPLELTTYNGGGVMCWQDTQGEFQRHIYDSQEHPDPHHSCDCRTIEDEC